MLNEVADRKPKVDGYVPREPLPERGLETVPYAEGERHRSQNGEHDKEKGPHGIYQQRYAPRISVPAMLRKASQFFFSRLYIPPPRTCPGGKGGYLWLTSPALMADGQSSIRSPGRRFGIAQHGLPFQFLLLRPVLFHIQRLPLKHLVRTLYYRAEHGVQRAEHQRGEKLGMRIPMAKGRSRG